MESELPPLMTFVLPGSSLQNSYCHIARTVCRRGERCVVELSINEKVEEIIIRYLNRLSDHLFVLSRYITLKQHGEDIPWKP
jgi:cob(I)alamin adenosyltransferase